MVSIHWVVQVLGDQVRTELESQPVDVRASFLRISRLIESEGLHIVREPYVKHLEGPLWEMRLKGKDGIARNASSISRRGVFCVF